MGRVLWMVWLCLVTHPLLDAFTVYGTQVLLPFSDYPVAWSTLFIIDPLYTLPLVVGVVAAWYGVAREHPKGLTACVWPGCCSVPAMCWRQWRRRFTSIA